MHRAGDLLGGAVRRLKRAEATIAWLSSTWPTIVGKMLAAHTRPVRCDNGILEIATDGKEWKSQLEPMSAEFRGRINQAWGAGLVTEVKFAATRRAAAKPSDAHSGGRAYTTRATDEEHLPFIRRGK